VIRKPSPTERQVLPCWSHISRVLSFLCVGCKCSPAGRTFPVFCRSSALDVSLFRRLQQSHHVASSTAPVVLLRWLCRCFVDCNSHIMLLRRLHQSHHFACPLVLHDQCTACWWAVFQGEQEMVQLYLPASLRIN
jgi:hypothetical protein